MELALHGLSEFEVLNKEYMLSRWVFKDFLADEFGGEEDEDLGDLFN